MACTWRVRIINANYYHVYCFAGVQLGGEFPVKVSNYTTLHCPRFKPRYDTTTVHLLTIYYFLLGSKHQWRRFSTSYTGGNRPEVCHEKSRLIILYIFYLLSTWTPPNHSPPPSPTTQGLLFCMFLNEEKEKRRLSLNRFKPLKLLTVFPSVSIRFLINRWPYLSPPCQTHGWWAWVRNYIPATPAHVQQGSY